METNFMNTRQAAEILGLKSNTLEIWRHRGTGPKFYKLGRACRYRLEDIEQWAEARVKTPESDLQSCV